MAKKWLPLISILFLLLTIVPEANACEPCMNVLNFAQTVNQATLIITGYKVADGPVLDTGPDWIEIQIVEVLQGNVPANSVIRVNSWSGMCDYGILIDDADTHVIFLEWRNGEYDAVESGCSMKTLPIQNDAVTMPNGEQVSLDGFVEMLGPNTTRIEVPPESTHTPIWLILAGIGGCLIVLLAGVGAAMVILKRNSG